MSASPRLRGFVGECAGGAELLAWMRPVIEHDGGLFAATRDDWTTTRAGDLVRISEANAQYANLDLFSPSEAPTIAEGNGVWMAGGRLLNTLSQVVDLKVHGTLITEWPKYCGGFSFDWGTYNAFRTLSNKLFNDASGALVRSLFSRPDWDTEISRSLFRMSSMLVTDERPQQLLVEALYHRDRKAFEEVDITREFAVGEGLFDSEAAFDEALADLMTGPQGPPG
jgi:hypothetical protein